MTDQIDADDLAMLAAGFEAAMAGPAGAAEIDRAIFDLGWSELLEAAPTQGAATAFTALGAAGSASGLLDDVLAVALGLDVAPTTCIVLPGPHRTSAPGKGEGESVAVDGLLSTRSEGATTIVLATDRGVVALDRTLVDPPPADGIDPGAGYRRVRAVLPASDTTPLSTTGSWPGAVAAAQVALAHQLVAAARWMLGAAREHALDRVQFGKPIASFQAIRHKLAETLVQVEAAASVAGACTDDGDPLLAALAKSLAGKATRTAATHTQQVLAGIGFTTDHQFHRWLKRTLVLDTLLGSATSLPTEIGRQLLDRGAAPRLLQL